MLCLINNLLNYIHVNVSRVLDYLQLEITQFMIFLDKIWSLSLKLVTLDQMCLHTFCEWK